MTNGWKPTSLGDILKQERRPVVLDAEKKYAEIGVYSYGRGIFHKEPRTGFEVGNKDLYEIKQGDFIFQITFAWEGAIALASEAEDGMYGSVRFPTYRVKEDICHPKFLLNYFKTEEGRREVGRISPGSAGRNRVLATKRLPEIFVPLPPLTEQCRIVEDIELLAVRVNEAQRLREELDKEADYFSLSAGNEIFEKLNLEEVTFGSLVIQANNGFGRRPKSEESGPIVLRLADVSSGQVSLANPRRVDMSEKEYEQYKVGQGDLIFVRVNGSLSIVGRCIFCEFDPTEKVTYNDHLIRTKINLEKLDPKFAMLWMNSPESRKLVESRAITTAGQYSISQTSILSLPIKLPPLGEQRRIVAYLDGLQAKVNALRELQSASGEELSAMMPSVLDRAFKGEL